MDWRDSVRMYRERGPRPLGSKVESNSCSDSGYSGSKPTEATTSATSHFTAECEEGTRHQREEADVTAQDNHPIMSSVQAVSVGLNEELCLLPLTGAMGCDELCLLPLAGVTGIELCLPPLQRGRFFSACPEPSKSQTELSSEDVENGGTPQGSMVHSQPVGGGSDPPKEPHTATVKTASEAALDDLCWIPFGIQSQSVGPEGGKLCLDPSAGAMGGGEGETILLEVPPGAVSPSESVEVRSALMPDGPFTLPEGYQLGSMVVYLYYDGQCVTKPFTLLLPHWYGGEDQVRDGLSFAMAPHTLKEGERVYHFELLEGGKMLSSHCGELEIDGHSSQFVVVFREGATSHYQATSLIREGGNETRCHVAVTYAFPLWRGILKKYRHGWTVNEPSCAFTFGDDGKLILKLQRESGNGWQAGIDGSHELQPCDVEYGTYGIIDYKLLKEAVSTGGYPRILQCAVTYKEVLRRTGRPVWVCMDLLGAGTKLTFLCNAYEEDDQQLDGRNAASAASQSLLTPPHDTRKSTTPPEAKTAEESLEKRVLNANASQFLQVVAVYRIYRELREKKVIDKTVEKAITNSHSVEEARGRLFDHMRDYGTLDTLKIFCDVITSEEYDGIRAMQDFGSKIKTTLDQD